MQGQCIYPIYSIETLILKAKDEKQVVFTKLTLSPQKYVQGARNCMIDKRNDVKFEKIKRKVSKVLVPVRWRVKKGNWKFPFQLPGLSNLIVISSML